MPPRTRTSSPTSLGSVSRVEGGDGHGRANRRVGSLRLPLSRIFGQRLLQLLLRKRGRRDKGRLPLESPGM